MRFEKGVGHPGHTEDGDDGDHAGLEYGAVGDLLYLALAADHQNDRTG